MIKLTDNEWITINYLSYLSSDLELLSDEEKNKMTGFIRNHLNGDLSDDGIISLSKIILSSFDGNLETENQSMDELNYQSIFG